MCGIQDSDNSLRRKPQNPFFNGAYLNLNASEEFVGKIFYKALEDCAIPRSSVRDSSIGDGCSLKRQELFPLQAANRREDSLDCLNSLDSWTHRISPRHPKPQKQH
ncbi:hypothetical protein PDJAM_G00212960 [Pangasius djambal]|uniref:Uncharacterized protein n=1 Tax=Pangasius djambal TaxID=1691987 RepID=A0ACC5YAB2_9TELE|nr:hypothetical protein [Pangasius djambal]